MRGGEHYTATFDDLVRFQIRVWNAVDKRLRGDTGVSLGTFDVLSVVAKTVGCRVQDIAQQLSITIGGASQAVDRLTRDGLCDRRPHPTDRRSGLVILTQRGREVLDKGAPIIEGELASWFVSTLTSSEFEDLSRSLSKLRETPEPLLATNSEEDPPAALCEEP